MAKIDNQLAAIVDGFQDSELRSGTTWVPDDQMEALMVRRKKSGQAKHKLFYLTVGETGQNQTTFWGYKFSDCLLKALAWRNLPTKNRRGPKAPQQQPVA